MGLDMYLERYPRYKDIRPENIHALEDFVEWKNDPEAQKYSLEEWCGWSESLVPNAKDGEYLKQFLTTRYYAWDTDRKYPHTRVYEQVAYWRKANQIHGWFVKNVQGGVDDCAYHDEVTKEKLEELINICQEILLKAELAAGKIANGYRFDANGKMLPIMQDGCFVTNSEVCEKLLPTESGYFFGNTEYNEFYINDVRYTYETLKKVLEETDFEKQMLFYCSSW